MRGTTFVGEADAARRPAGTYVRLSNRDPHAASAAEGSSYPASVLLDSLDGTPLDRVDLLLLDWLEFGTSDPPGWVLERFHGLTMEQVNAIDLVELAPYLPEHRLDVVHVDALSYVNAIPLDRLTTTGGWQAD